MKPITFITKIIEFFSETELINFTPKTIGISLLFFVFISLPLYKTIKNFNNPDKYVKFFSQRFTSYNNINLIRINNKVNPSEEFAIPFVNPCFIVVTPRKYEYGSSGYSLDIDIIKQEVKE